MRGPDDKFIVPSKFRPPDSRGPLGASAILSRRSPLPTIESSRAKMNSRIFCIIAAVLAGCASTTPSPPPKPATMFLPFSEADFAAWGGSGNADIRGQALLTTLGGDVKTCAGESVVLIPDNSYGRDFFETLLANKGQLPSNMDPRLDAYMRAGKCDGQGVFLFRNVKPNRWLIFTRVIWFAPSFSASAGYGLSEQGGVLKKSIVASLGENQVILSGADLLRR
jgi:hypothetical protein